MERMATMPMHAAAHVLTRAHMANVCAWTIGNVPFASGIALFGTSKAYGTRRLGSLST
jgi:hypothetical protein